MVPECRRIFGNHRIQRRSRTTSGLEELELLDVVHKLESRSRPVHVGHVALDGNRQLFRDPRCGPGFAPDSRTRAEHQLRRFVDAILVQSQQPQVILRERGLWIEFECPGKHPVGGRQVPDIARAATGHAERIHIARVGLRRFEACPRRVHRPHEILVDRRQLEQHIRARAELCSQRLEFSGRRLQVTGRHVGPCRIEQRFDRLWFELPPETAQLQPCRMRELSPRVFNRCRHDLQRFGTA